MGSANEAEKTEILNLIEEIIETSGMNDEQAREWLDDLAYDITATGPSRS